MFYGKIFLRKVLNLADLKVDTYMSYTTNLFELELVSLTHYHSAEFFFQLKLYHSKVIFTQKRLFLCDCQGRGSH